MTEFNSIKLKNQKATAGVLIFALVLLAVRLFLVRFHTDPQTGFYDAAYPLLYRIFDTFVGGFIVAVFLCQFLLYRKKKSYEMTNSFIQGSQTLIFSSAFVAFLMLFAAFKQGYELIVEYNALSATGALAQFLIKDNLITFLSVVLSILSAVYFFMTAATKPPESSEIIKLEEPDEEEKATEAGIIIKTNKNSVLLFFSFMPIIWTVCRLLSAFFDRNSPINSSARVYEITALVALMLYFVAESRFFTQRYFTAKFYPLAYISVILLLLHAMPNLLFFYFWILEPNSLAIYSAVEITLVLYIIARLYSQTKYSQFYYVPETE